MCFIHIISKNNYIKKLAIFFKGRVTGYLGRVRSRVNLFLLRIKKIEFKTGIFQVRSGQKNSDLIAMSSKRHDNGRSMIILLRFFMFINELRD